jgi:predicted DNA-binding ribbon-helix-helix protein
MPRDKNRQHRPHWVAIGNRQSSVRLEPEFYFWLRQIAAEQGSTLKSLVETVEKAKNAGKSLSSAACQLRYIYMTTQRSGPCRGVGRSSLTYFGLALTPHFSS